MYAAAWMLSGSTSVAVTTGMPYFHLGSQNILGLPIQSFGVIVAAGVLIGAALLRRYGEWHGISDEEIRGLTGWVTVFGFLGAHVFDTLFYEWVRFEEDPLLIFKLWDGISSYGGFLGGSVGFALFIWWKRLPLRLFADTTLVGLLPAFSIGRIGCSVVSDHVGGAADPTAWYSFLAMDYARTDGTALNAQHQPEILNSGIAHLFNTTPNAGDHLLGWNLGLIELLYLIPINLLILYLAFRPTKRLPAGFITALAGILYAPVRFFLDYLRPDNSDPRHLGFTFAQWCSIAAFGIAVYAANRVLRKGKVFPTVTRTSGEAQAKLKSILKDDGDKTKRGKDEVDADQARKDKEKARLKEEQRLEDEALEREAMEAGKKAAKADAKAEKAEGAKAGEPPDDEDEEDDADDDGDEAVPEPAKPVTKSGQTKSGGQTKPSGQNKNPGQNTTKTQRQR
jgi:phosphatidylglycerol:prolipoprotein diacylglycerol transferase